MLPPRKHSHEIYFWRMTFAPGPDFVGNLLKGRNAIKAFTMHLPGYEVLNEQLVSSGGIRKQNGGLSLVLHDGRPEADVPENVILALWMLQECKKMLGLLNMSDRQIETFVEAANACVDPFEMSAEKIITDIAKIMKVIIDTPES